MSQGHPLANQVIGHACHRTMHMNTSFQVVRTNNAQSGELKPLELYYLHTPPPRTTPIEKQASMHWSTINKMNFHNWIFILLRIPYYKHFPCNCVFVLLFKGFLRRWNLFVHNEYPISIIPVGFDWESLKTEVGHWALIDDKKLRTGVELNPPDDCGHGTWSTFL